MKRLSMYAFAAACVAGLAAFAFIAFTSRPDLLPATLQPQDYKLSVQKANSRLQALVREAFVVEGGKSIVVVLPERLGLVHVDTATGKAVLKKLPSEVVPAAYDVAIPFPEGRFARDGSLFWSGDTGELVDLHTAQRRKADLEPGEQVPLGFVDGANRLMVFDPVRVRIVALDTQTGKTVYATDVTPASGLPSPTEKQELRDRILLYGAFSHDNSRFGWIWLDQLHVMEAATGAVRVIALPAVDNMNVDFSRDARFVLTRKYAEGRPGSLVDLSTGTVKPHSIAGFYNVLHFSEAGGLVVQMPPRSSNRMGITIARWNVTYLAPEWERDLVTTSLATMTDDGRRLFVYNSQTQQVESAGIAGVSNSAPFLFEQLPMALPPGTTYAMKYSAHGRLLVVVQTPKMAFAHLDESGAVLKTTVVDFSGFNPKP